MAKVSFDFDGTLEREVIQEYAKELVDSGHEVWVVTTRYDDEKLVEVSDKQYLESNLESNQKLLAIANSVGIPRERIKFTNMKWKYSFLREGEFDLHLDDTPTELNLINKYAKKVSAISCKNTSTWKNKCEKVLKNLE